MPISSHQSVACFGLPVEEFGSGELNSASQKHEGFQPGLALAGSLFSKSSVSLPDLKFLHSWHFLFFFHFSSSYIVDFHETSRVKKSLFKYELLLSKKSNKPKKHQNKLLGTIKYHEREKKPTKHLHRLSRAQRLLVFLWVC